MNKQILFTELEIQHKVEELAHIINNKTHTHPPVFICVLNGAFMFFTDLVKQVSECEIDFIRAKSYVGTTQTTLNIIKSIEIDIYQKDVYLIDDIYDTGRTIQELSRHLSFKGPKSITPITLFKKYNSNHPDLIYGFELHDESWLVGYGLNNDEGLQRNLKHVLGLPKED